jgi:hypothetical protein
MKAIVVTDQGILCRPHLEGREAGRSAGASADEVRAGDQYGAALLRLLTAAFGTHPPVR